MIGHKTTEFEVVKLCTSLNIVPFQFRKQFHALLMTKMTGSLHLPLLAVMLCSFSVLVQASIVELNGFTDIYGLTGCLFKPTEGCGRAGNDVCYDDVTHSYAISGTSPICVACMPKNFRNIATFQVPANLPCALWRAYGCDDHFVSSVYERTGTSSCSFSGYKSYNIRNVFSSAEEAQEAFLEQCRKFRTFAEYGLPDTTPLITEEQFCSPLSNNMADIKIAAVGGQEETVLTNYKEYYEQKFNV